MTPRENKPSKIRMHNRIVRAATQRRIMFFFVIVFERRVNLKILKRNNIPKTKNERLKNLVLPESLNKG
jgi:hypothetical protein